jgi:hypothetical protein
MAYVMVYVLFEELFYSMVAPHRAANSFCYKMTSLDPHDVVLIQDTNKYCGLNLAPLKRQCTVEFRQMDGTSDLRRVRRWLQLIVKLHAWVESQKSREAVPTVIGHIERGSFVELAKEIWGVNASLFSDIHIHSSAKENALWALCLSEREFV